MEILINSDRKINLEKKGSNFIANGERLDAEVIRVNEHFFKVFKDNKVYGVEVLEQSSEEISLIVNGELISTKLVSEMDELLKKLGMSSGSSTTVKELKAPMPGTILSLSQTSGREVKKGDPILILEAMKMENVIKSPGDGVIKTIHVSECENVEKNQKLISFE